MLLNNDAWSPSWIRGSKLDEIVWIAKYVLAWCTGINIVFFNINEKKLSFRWCWNSDSGEGARCLSGHSKFPIFAFAEKTMQPRIIVISYPSMTKVSECTGGCPSGYLATAFTAQDYMVSVGFYPHFSMIVWNWRTGEKIISVNTHIRDEVGQILRITQGEPTVIAQMGKTCGTMFTWELNIAGNVAVLKDHEVQLPNHGKIAWIDWCPTSSEPLLAITDTFGHIFLSNYDGSNVYRIVLSQRCGICTDIALPLVHWFRDGIVLRTTFCQIRFYTKNVRKDRWQRTWYVTSVTKPYIVVIHPSNNNRFFYHTFEGYLMQIDFFEEDENPRISKYLDYGAIHRFVDFVYPWCHHLVVSDDSKGLLILECYSGTPVSTFDADIDGEVACQVSHPDYPMIVLGTTQGEAIFLSLVQPITPTIVASLKLQREPLDLIKFSYSGRFLIAAEKASGNCYCINLHREKAYTVQTLIRVQRSITDLLVYEAFRKLRVLVLFVGVAQYEVGQQLMVFEVQENQNLVTDVVEILDLPGVYRAISYVPGNPTLFVGSPYLTRQLRVQKVQDYKDVIMVDGLATGHQVRLANIFVDRAWISTTALDGLVLVRDKTVRQLQTCIMTHHRTDFGTVKAMVNRNGDFIVCIGYNGSLVAVRSVPADNKKNTATPGDEPFMYKVDYALYEKYQRKIFSDYVTLDPTAYGILTRRRSVFPGPKQKDKTWSEWREEFQILQETETCKEEKEKILQDFKALKGKVKKLVDENEVCPKIEKLPMSSFDLDKAGRDHKLKAGRDDCEDLRLKLEHDIGEMKRVTRWIRETFWNPQTILGKSIIAIFGTEHVTNYPSVAEDSNVKYRLQLATFYKEVIQTIVENETFRPWQLYDKEELEIELGKRLKLKQEERRRIDLLFAEEEDEEIVEEDTKEEIAMEGTTTHRFIAASPYYSQLECYAFDQLLINNYFLMHDCAELRIHFNRAFDEMYEKKEREMNMIQARIERIRHIDSELRSMFGQHVPRVPTDSKWHWKERPEDIIKVLDHEVKAKPYVSPSQQEILDKQAAEEERIRQLLLADDFRERALMTMMGGVLEVRWEDTIKIDVPKPACMLQKKPEDYTAEDLQVVKQYEKDVQFLQEERERYKRMLETEYVRVMGLLQEGIDKFNEKLNELFKLKMNIEAAINQMNLRYIRGYIQIYNREQSLQEEMKLKTRITEKEEYENTLKSDLQTYQNVHQQLIAKYELLDHKQKVMSKRFKSEFSSMSKLNLELLERQYKRRPKTNLKNLGPSELLELGHHVLKKSRPIFLPSECNEYLKALDHLDVRPTTLPPTIDTSQWDHLIRLRRLKIDAEFKTRSKQVQIVDAETVILGFEQRIEKCKAEVERTKKNLEETRRRRTISNLDVEVQLVLKMGQVEINTNGNMKDTETAILISHNEIESVNKLIRAAGACKLKALSQLLNFQQGTLMKQWEHECKRKRLEDLREDLRFTESVTVTKEMQLFLKRKARGMKEDKTQQQLAEHIEAMKQGFEQNLDEQKDRLQSIQTEIESTRSKNKQLDQQILEMNVARCEMEQRRDLIGEARQQEHAEKKLKMIMKRAALIKKLQDNYAELLELQTEHELLRLRRYPTFGFKMLDDKPKPNDDPPSRFDSCPC
ncbi:cilia- and flagella-associated protein 43 [Osmia lignaria lignaria]|uniref:cilia- and flagella-associated protein 43 n=1 Tax=Osmia lignaria lignaria TaxID=1437193 RepID=UPI00402BEE13